MQRNSISVPEILTGTNVPYYLINRKAKTWLLKIQCYGGRCNKAGKANKKVMIWYDSRKYHAINKIGRQEKEIKILFILAYVDDLITWTENKEDSVELFDNVEDNLSENRLTINYNKITVMTNDSFSEKFLIVGSVYKMDYRNIPMTYKMTYLEPT